MRVNITEAKAYPMQYSSHDVTDSSLDRMLFHQKVTSSSMLSIPIYLPGGKELKWNRLRPAH